MICREGGFYDIWMSDPPASTSEGNLPYTLDVYLDNQTSGPLTANTSQCFPENIYPAQIPVGTMGHWQFTISEKLLSSEAMFVVGPGQYQIGEDMLGFSIQPTPTSTRYGFSVAVRNKYPTPVVCDTDRNNPSPLPGWDSNQPLTIYLKALPNT
ncbi:hypothetical protein BDD14_1782 [Edaphobacter modestus]|uniref:Uncharacterized protein n=1 Tax=Edaphobacter modestus TaxID=388466 RepID=A0A4Q7YTK7_9BACT|nr:hypothetical protein BDD14_1782 [Edaphobacter modestus]